MAMEGNGHNSKVTNVSGQNSNSIKSIYSNSKMDAYMVLGG